MHKTGWVIVRSAKVRAFMWVENGVIGPDNTRWLFDAVMESLGAYLEILPIASIYGIATAACGRYVVKLGARPGSSVVSEDALVGRDQVVKYYPKHHHDRKTEDRLATALENALPYVKVAISHGEPTIGGAIKALETNPVLAEAEAAIELARHGGCLGPYTTAVETQNARGRVAQRESDRPDRRSHHRGAGRSVSQSAPD